MGFFCFVFYHFSTFEQRRQLTPFSTEDNEPSVCHSQLHWCWWPGNIRSRGINSYGTDLLWIFFNIRRTKSRNLNVCRLALQSLCPNHWSQVENEDVVGVAPTGDAPTTSEWSTILLLTSLRLILEVWRPISRNILTTARGGRLMDKDCHYFKKIHLKMSPALEMTAILYRIQRVDSFWPSDAT